MDVFYPFIHEPERKKENFEPLYIELEPIPNKKENQEENQEEHVITIEIL